MNDQPDEPTSDSTDPAAEPRPATDAQHPDTEAAETIDLERISADFDGVAAALQRLDDGTYWTDEVTGAEIPDRVLATDPVARRVDTG